MKFTPERRQIIIDAIKEGNTKKTAAALAGIDRKTLYDWLDRGRNEEPPELDGMTMKALKARARENKVKGYSRMSRDLLVKAIIENETAYRSFLYAVEQAEAQGMAQHVKNIRQAGLEDWKASAWFLERRDPENYARRDALKVENQHSGKIETESHHKETRRIELLRKFENDPKLAEHYMAIWERENIGNGDS